MFDTYQNPLGRLERVRLLMRPTLVATDTADPENSVVIFFKEMDGKFYILREAKLITMKG